MLFQYFFSVSCFGLCFSFISFIVLHFDCTLLRAGPLLHMGGNRDLFRRFSILHCERRMFFFRYRSFGMFPVLVCFLCLFGHLVLFFVQICFYLAFFSHPPLRSFYCFSLLFLLPFSFLIPALYCHLLPFDIPFVCSSASCRLLCLSGLEFLFFVPKHHPTVSGSRSKEDR